MSCANATGLNDEEHVHPTYIPHRHDRARGGHDRVYRTRKAGLVSLSRHSCPFRGGGRVKDRRSLAPWGGGHAPSWCRISDVTYGSTGARRGAFHGGMIAKGGRE